MSFESSNQDRDMETVDYKLVHSEIPIEYSEQIVLIANEAVERNHLEKDAAYAIVTTLRNMEKFENLGQGEWQCFIGKYLACSLSYDSGVFLFFNLTKHKKNVLLFKS